MTNRSDACRRSLPLAPLVTAASMLAAISTLPAETLLPDLIVQPELLSQNEIDRRTEPGRELLRLTSGTANIGLGPLEIRGGAVLSATEVEVAQRLYHSDGTVFDRLAGVFTYHPSHGHVHFEAWTVFRLREALENGGIGGIVAQGSKVSFCLLDSVVCDATNPSFDPYPSYLSCGFDVQGISPGWGDTYFWWLPDQWIDITGIPDGTYWLEVEADPDNRLLEADETNNVARVLIRLRPPEAQADRYEENDSFDEVASRDEGGPGSPNLGPIDARRTIDDLSMDGDLDLFLFRLDHPAEATGFIRIDSPWSVGDLNLALYDSGRSRLVASTSPSNTERVSLAGAPAGTYFIQIVAQAGTNPAYTLTIDPSGDPCPPVPEGDPRDADGDRRADDCDNCPGVANPDQADANRDGGGDACQPILGLAGIVEDGGEFLEVRAIARDPQGDPLSGAVMVQGPSFHPVQLQDALLGNGCDLAFLPEATAGEGIAFTFGAIGEPYLFDADEVLGCDDGVADYALAAGACGRDATSFDTAIPLAGLALPAPICIRRAGAQTGGTTLTIEAFDPASMRGRLDLGVERLLEAAFAGSLPRRLPLPAMAVGQTYDLVFSVTDGTTPPILARSSFLYSGERVLLVNTPPAAVLATAQAVECEGPTGGSVRLDASGSGDVDSTPGTEDDVAAFEWFEDFGGSMERRLGLGERLEAVLPLGLHHLTLRVTDAAGESGVAGATIAVVDSIPPSLTVAVHPRILWPPDHRMVPIELVWQVLDVCDPSVRLDLVTVTSSEPDDAAGTGDGATRNDIDGIGSSPLAGLRLRAERAGGGPGRTYALTYVATDRVGNVTTRTVDVTVPAAPPTTVKVPAASSFF